MHRVFVPELRRLFVISIVEPAEQNAHPVLLRKAVQPKSSTKEKLQRPLMQNSVCSVLFELKFLSASRRAALKFAADLGSSVIDGANEDPSLHRERDAIVTPHLQILVTPIVPNKPARILTQAHPVGLVHRYIGIRVGEAAGTAHLAIYRHRTILALRGQRPTMVADVWVANC